MGSYQLFHPYPYLTILLGGFCWGGLVVPVNLMVYRDFRFLVHDDDDDDDDDDVLVCWTGCYIAKGISSVVI